MLILSNVEFDVCSSHVRWKIEFVWFAIKSEQIVVFSQFRQKQSRQQMWFHIKSHYVILSCDDYICFQINQIRNIWINTYSRKSFASIFDFSFDFIYLVFFSIFKNFSLFFCLQTLSRTFCHLSIYRLNRVKCFQSWKQWNIYENALLTFRFFSFYFEKVLIFSKSLLRKSFSMLFVCLFVFFLSDNVDRSWFEKA